jgi:hypothetical protein
MTECMGIGKADLLVELLAALLPPRLERTQESINQTLCGGGRGIDGLGGEDEGGCERPFGVRSGERGDEGVAGVEKGRVACRPDSRIQLVFFSSVIVGAGGAGKLLMSSSLGGSRLRGMKPVKGGTSTSGGPDEIVRVLLSAFGCFFPPSGVPPVRTRPSVQGAAKSVECQ